MKSVLTLGLIMINQFINKPDNILRCPRCHSADIVKWNPPDNIFGKQAWRCITCDAEFNRPIKRDDMITKDDFIRAMYEQIERLEKELEKSYANIS